MKTKTKFKPEHLNQNLVARNNVSHQAQMRLCELYDELEALIEEGDASLSVEVNREIADKIEQLELNLQRLWGFPQDEEFHRYWLNIGSCSCPKMDNMDRLGYGRIINLDCPVHGTSQDI